jgi:hypothetical protein
MRRLIERLPDPVLVHYDPENSASSYLVSNPTWMVWLLVAFGVLALLLGAVLLVTA